MTAHLIAIAIAAKLGAPLIRPASQAVDSAGTLQCIALTRHETQLRGGHAFACADATGAILGAVLGPTGRVLCPIHGALAPGAACGTATVCGRTESTCR